MSNLKMRLVGWSVQPIIMSDDGINLTPVEVHAQILPAAQWDSFINGGYTTALESIRTQIETIDPAPFADTAQTTENVTP